MRNVRRLFVPDVRAVVGLLGAVVWSVAFAGRKRMRVVWKGGFVGGMTIDSGEGKFDDQKETEQMKL